MDILPWWKVSLLLNCQRTISLILNHTKENEATFPVIARMALDFLACPGSSVAVERLFSSSRHLCRDLRSSLKAETIMEGMCTKTWIKEGVVSLHPVTGQVTSLK
jgi:hypothetical protein